MIKLLKSLYFHFASPNKVAEISGVIFGNNCKFRTKRFGDTPNFIKVGDNFATSTGVLFVTHDGSVNVFRNLNKEFKDFDYFQPIVIGNNVFIGARVTILPGTRIGDNIIVGAGSIVKGNLKSNSVYAGIPSKYICSIDEYLEKNKHNFIRTKNLRPKEKRKFLNKWLVDNFEEFQTM